MTLVLYDSSPLKSVLIPVVILLTVALFRFLHPKAELRFAGGRKRLPREVQLKALRIGINAAVVGDLLTTVGSKIDEDRQLASEPGYIASANS